MNIVVTGGGGSIETMLHAVEEAGAVGFAHPRYDNIDWMTLLEEAH